MIAALLLWFVVMRTEGFHHLFQELRCHNSQLTDKSRSRLQMVSGLDSWFYKNKDFWCGCREHSIVRLRSLQFFASPYGKNKASTVWLLLFHTSWQALILFSMKLANSTPLGQVSSKMAATLKKSRSYLVQFWVLSGPGYGSWDSCKDAHSPMSSKKWSPSC